MDDDRVGSRPPKALVTETVIDQTARRVPVIAQTGVVSTAEAIELSRHAQDAGASVLMLVTPYYEPLTLDETVRYLHTVAGKVDIPIMLYNLPGAPGVNLSPDIVGQLARKIDNVCYIKDTSADVAQDAQLIHHHGDVISTFVGMDSLLLASLAEGAAGTVVLAAGAWSGPLAASVGIELPIRSQREQILLIDTGAPVTDVPVFSDLVTLQYLRQETGGAVLYGNSDHSNPEFADPDNYTNHADTEFIETAIGKLDHRLPTLPDPRISASYAGCYDTTPDYNPIIGPTDVPALFVAAGFSGHGYKIAPAVGRLVADLITDGASSDPNIPADDFRLSRFTEGAPLVSAHPYVGAGEMR